MSACAGLHIERQRKRKAEVEIRHLEEKKKLLKEELQQKSYQIEAEINKLKNVK